VAINQKNNLAIFGYTLDKKVAQKNPSVCLTTCWNLSYKFCDLEKQTKSNQNLVNLDLFFHGKILGKNHIFQVFLFFHLLKMWLNSFWVLLDFE
jgi:hypothetical protein